LSSCVSFVSTGGLTTYIAPRVKLDPENLRILKRAAGVASLREIYSLRRPRVNVAHTHFYEVRGATLEDGVLRERLVALDPETMEMVRFVGLCPRKDRLSTEVKVGKGQIPDICLSFLAERKVELPDGYVQGKVRLRKVGPEYRYELVYRHEVNGVRILSDFVRFEVDATTGEVITYSKVHHRVEVSLKPSVSQDEAGERASEVLKECGFDPETLEVLSSSLKVVYPNGYLEQMRKGRSLWRWSEEQALCWVVRFGYKGEPAVDVWVDAHTGKVQGGEVYELPVSQIYAVPNQEGDADIQRPYLELMQYNTSNVFKGNTTESAVVDAMADPNTFVFVLHTHGSAESTGESARLRHSGSWDSQHLTPDEVPNNSLRYALISCCHSGDDNPGDDFKDTFIDRGGDCFQGYEGSINPDPYEDSEFYYLAQGYTVQNADLAAAAATSPTFDRTFTWSSAVRCYNHVRLAPLFVTLSKATLGRVRPGGTFKMEARVRNREDARYEDAHNVTAQLVLPSGFSIVSGSNPQSLGTLTYGTTKKATWTVRAGSELWGTYTFDVVVRSDDLGVEVDDPYAPYNPCDVEVGWPVISVADHLYKLLYRWRRIDPKFVIPEDVDRELRRISSGEVDVYLNPEVLYGVLSRVVELGEEFGGRLGELGPVRDLERYRHSSEELAKLLAQARELRMAGPGVVDRLLGLQQEVISSLTPVVTTVASSGYVAYVYSTDSTKAGSYRSLLEANGIAVDLLRMEDLAASDLGAYEAIILGSDTGYLRTWGDAASVSAVQGTGKPIIGLGEGGYAFFGKLGLSVGWPHGWHGTEASIHVSDPSHPLFLAPNSIYIEPEFRVLNLYTATGHVGIYLPSVPTDVEVLGREVGDPEHYPLVLEGRRYVLWGFTGSPDAMTSVGRELFVNLVYFVRSLMKPPRIRSVWASTPPTVDGDVEAGEWSGAPTVPIAYGNLRFQNDDRYLYILVDLTGDTHDDPPSGDYPWVTFDLEADRNITPGEDLNYVPYPGTYELGLQRYLGPGVWTGPDTTRSMLGVGFGPSPSSATPHRIWEFAISLEEVGEDPSTWLADEELPLVRLGLRTHSQVPNFEVDLPWNFEEDFSDLLEVLLAMRPSYSGPIFSGVGLVPATEIVDGYATTDSSYYLYVRDAPFGGRLHVFGNFHELRARGAKYYKVLCSKVGSTDPPVPLRQSWTNYRWETDRFVPQVVGPDAGDRYEIPPASEIWYLDDLLITWRTWPFENGRYKLQLEAYTSAGASVYLPESQNQLVLTIDNTRPKVEISEISHAGAPVGRCDIVYLGDPPDGLRFTLRASDPEGHLLSYALVAHYGDNERRVIEAEGYGSHTDEDGPHLWDGIADTTVPSAPWRPPEPCAYQFRLSARGRTINGYNRIHYVEYNKHVTLLFGAPTCGTLEFTMSLTPGLNMISLPLRPARPYTARSLLGALGGTMIVGMEGGRFVPFLPRFPGDGFTIEGGKGYVVNVPRGTSVTFTGTGWSDRASRPAPPGPTWAFVVGGLLKDAEPGGRYIVTVKNTRTGAVATDEVGSTCDRCFAVAWVDLSRKEVVEVGDRLEVTLTDRASGLMFGPLVHEVTVQDLEDASLVLDIERSRMAPMRSALLANYPNPFNLATRIPYVLAEEGHVLIKIYDVSGRTVRTLDLGRRTAGVYTAERAAYWDGRDGSGQEVASGVYIYAIQAGKFSAARKMLMVK